MDDPRSVLARGHAPDAPPPRYRAITRANVHDHPLWTKLDPAAREAIRVVSAVLPFKTNHYVVDALIDWDRVPDDPIFQLTFVQREMLQLGLGSPRIGPRSAQQRFGA